MDWIFFALSTAASLLLAPLSIGFINKTKAFFAGRSMGLTGKGRSVESKTRKVIPAAYNKIDN